MKKSIIMAGIAVGLMVCPLLAENTLFEGTATLSPTNTVQYLNTVGAGEWATLDHLYIASPGNKTGTVDVAAFRGGDYVNVVSLSVTNSVTNLLHTISSSLAVPVSGRIRMTFTQEGTSTNVWKFGLFLTR